MAKRRIITPANREAVLSKRKEVMFRQEMSELKRIALDGLKVANREEVSDEDFQIQGIGDVVQMQEIRDSFINALMRSNSLLDDMPMRPAQDRLRLGTYRMSGIDSDSQDDDLP